MRSLLSLPCVERQWSVEFHSQRHGQCECSGCMQSIIETQSQLVKHSCSTRHSAHPRPGRTHRRGRPSQHLEHVCS